MNIKLLAIYIVFTPALLVSMQLSTKKNEPIFDHLPRTLFHEPDEKEKAIQRSLFQKYASKIRFTLASKTNSFIDKHPQSTEAQIIARYIEAFVAASTYDSITDLTPAQIDEHYEKFSPRLPVSMLQLNFILTGKKEIAVSMFADSSCPDKWREELQKIEDRIANRSRAGCIMQ